ncbi:MAG: SDR family oxidoreductase [Paraperlucidibaca sp.]
MNQAVFITGAAAGIGRAVAIEFAHQGWFVGAADLDEVGLASLKSEIGNARCFTVALNVGDTKQWEKALASFWKASGERLDVLVNNAGILSAGAFHEIPIKRHQAIIDINVGGVLAGCHAAYPYLSKTPKAVVINMASASAIFGQPGLASYSASKFAVRGLTEALDCEWADQGIRVKSIWPLFVQTNMVSGMGNMPSVKSLGIKLNVDDVARAVWYAANDRGATSPIHYPVGLQTKVLSLAVKLSPAWMSRWINQRMTSD